MSLPTTQLSYKEQGSPDQMVNVAYFSLYYLRIAAISRALFLLSIHIRDMILIYMRIEGVGN